MSTTQPIRDSAKLKKFKEYYSAEKPSIRNHTLCVMGLNTALRISDILQLKWGNVYDFAEEKFLKHITVTEQKTGKQNIIALNEAITLSLTEYLFSLPVPPVSETYLFPSRKGINRPIGRSQAFRIVTEAAQAVGLNHHVSCHSLRKTFGYHAWRQGIPPVLLMNIYNHSSFQITQRYLGIEQDDKDDVFMHISL